MKKLAIATIYAGLCQNDGAKDCTVDEIVHDAIRAYKEIERQLGPKLDEDEERIFGGSSENSEKGFDCTCTDMCQAADCDNRFTCESNGSLQIRPGMGYLDLLTDQEKRKLKRPEYTLPESLVDKVRPYLESIEGDRVRIKDLLRNTPPENSRKSPKEQGPMDFPSVVDNLREGGIAYRELWSKDQREMWTIHFNVRTATIDVKDRSPLDATDYLAKDWVWKEA